MSNPESPTKQITMRLESLTLKDSLEDTVVYSQDDNATKADWEKVKMELQKNKKEHVKPKLVSLEESEHLSNETWNEMKHAYGMESAIIYEHQNYENNATEHIIDNFDQSTYSFQDLPGLRLKSASTLDTAKTTSFKSTFSDTPLEPPRLIKHPQETQRQPLNFKTEIKLIRPEDESMTFDHDIQKWVYPESAKSSDTNVNTVSKEDVNVTSISDAEVSFSVSKIALVTAITAILKPFADWDEVTSIDLSNKGLGSMVGINDLLPNLTEIILNNNNLTSFEGLPTKLSKLTVRNNKICGHLTNLSAFQDLLTLDASFNNIETMDVFKNLRNLRELNLSHNKIDTLIDLPNIMKLNVSNNKIRGEVDFQDYHFPWLWNLNVSHNKITSIKNVSHLKDLLRLEVSHNTLNFIDSNNPRLRHLEVMGNPDEVTVCSLNELKILRIDGSVKLEGACEKLQELSIRHDNGLKFFDYKINRDLQSLDISACQLTEAHYEKIIEKFPNLHKINLQNNLIKGTFTELCDFLNKYKKLDYFNLDNNPLLSYLQTDEDKKEYKSMIYKIMNRH